MNKVISAKETLHVIVLLGALLMLTVVGVPGIIPEDHTVNVEAQNEQQRSVMPTHKQSRQQAIDKARDVGEVEIVSGDLIAI